MWTLPASSACQWASGPSPREDMMPTPVIQVSRGVSTMRQRLHRKPDAARHLAHAGAEFRVRKGHDLEGDLAVGDRLAVDVDRSLGYRIAGPLVQQARGERQDLS